MSIIGKGADYPFEFNQLTGGVAYERTSEALDRIKQSIMLILTTNPGERFFRPTYGSLIKRAVFEPNDPATLEFIRYNVQQAVNINEPRCTIKKIYFYPHQPDEHSVSLLIEVVIRSLGLSKNLVFPIIEQGVDVTSLPDYHSKVQAWG
jgi:hypothetical protein